MNLKSEGTYVFIEDFNPYQLEGRRVKVVCAYVSVAEGSGLLGNRCAVSLAPLWDKCSSILLDKPAHKDRGCVQQTGMESPCVPTAGLHQ